MTSLSRSTIKTRLTLGFAIVPLVMIGLITVGILRVNSISHSLHTINDVNSVKQRYAINFRGSVHDRAISLRDVVLIADPAGSEGAVGEIESLANDYEKSAGPLDALFAVGEHVSAEERKLLADIKDIEARTLPLVAQVIESRRAGRTEDARRLLLDQAKPAFTEWLARINRFIDHQEAENKAESLQARAVADGFQQLMIVLCLVSVAAAAVLAYYITRSIVLPLRQVTGQLGECSAQIGDAAGHLASSSGGLAEGSSKQASSLEEISASLQELSSMTTGNADNALAGKNSANAAREAAERGSEEMVRMQTAMGSIQRSSEDVAKIIKTIDEIAFQTNILALNAAVEAARAGEAGAGFAVVADEVRSLAQRAANAARETSEKIADATQRSIQGVEISNRVSAGFTEILAKVREVDARVAEVASASREQSTGLNQISSAVAQIDVLTQSNAASSEETASASNDLSRQSEILRDAAAQLVAMVRTRDQAHLHAPSSAARPTPPGTGGFQSSRNRAPSAPPAPVAVGSRNDGFEF